MWNELNHILVPGGGFLYDSSYDRDAPENRQLLRYKNYYDYGCLDEHLHKMRP